MPRRKINLSEPLETLPAIKGLTDRQSAFVYAYVRRGDRNGAAAAREAGYAPTNAATAAYRNLMDEDVQRAILELTRSQGVALMPAALNTMSRLLDHGSGQVRLAAAADLMNRFGLKPPERHQIALGGGVTIDIRLTE